MSERKLGVDKKIASDRADLNNILATLPLNPVPWVPVVKLVAPVIARLAVRLVLKKMARGLGDDKVMAVSQAVGATVSGILDKRVGV